eukprot:Awhi_evm1s12458
MVDGLDDILKDEELLGNILTYHVIKGEFSSDELKEGTMTTLNGQDIDISFMDGKVFVNGAEVLMADNAACNGV